VDIHRPSLSGLIPTAPYDPTNPLRDLELKRQWAAQYWQQAMDFANSVVGALQGMGFTVNVLGNSCDPAAGCIGLPQLQAILIKGGRSMDASIGNPVRFNSPQEEASYIASLFDMYAVSSAAFVSGTNTSVLTSSQPLTQQQVYQQQQQALQQSAPSVSQQLQQVQSTTSYNPPPLNTVRSAVLLAPQGYTVGSPWRIVVMGPPDRPVSVAASQNGRSLGETTYGRTDSGGRFEMAGNFAPGTEGTWQQIWKVGGEVVGTVNFTVLPAPGPSTPSGQTPSQQAGGMPGTQSIVSVGTPASTPSGISHAAVEPEAWYKQVPAWAWGIAALAGLFIWSKGK